MATVKTGPRFRTSLAEEHPEIAAEWHPTKNGELTPDHVTPGSGRRVWWLCSKGSAHEWDAVIGKRRSGSGCPYCAGKKIGKDNSLAAKHPKLAREWHPTRNGKLNADDVTSGSMRRVWWRCAKHADHEWRASIGHRVRGTGCRFCSGKAASASNSLLGVRPDIAEQWHPTRNGDATPAGVTAGSAKKYWWRCPVSKLHDWKSAVTVRTTHGAGCPFCAGRQAAADTSLRATFPEVAAEWHPTKNGKLTPDDVTPSSSKTSWWRCSDNKRHVWQARIQSRTTGRGCPTCAGFYLGPNNSLADHHPELVSEWHPTKNGDLTPEAVTPGVQTKVWWRCLESKYHDWQAAPANRVAGTGCPFCAGKRIAPDNHLQAKCPELAKEWHPTKNGELRPDQVTTGSPRRVWWRCRFNPNHEWEASLNQRARVGTGCSVCLAVDREENRKRKRKRKNPNVPLLV